MAGRTAGDSARRARNGRGDALAPDDPSAVRSVAVVGPMAAGKTTLIEELLAATGTIPRAGSVTAGTTVTDHDAEARRQQRSVSPAVASLVHRDVKINLIDTPGCPDFLGEVRAGLRAADAVLFVVAPTVEGTAHLRERLKGMADQLGLGAPDGVPVGVAVVTSYKDRRSAPDLQQLLDSEGLGARVLGVLAHDRKAADAMRGVGYAGTARSLLVRSAVEVGARLAALADHRHTPAR